MNRASALMELKKAGMIVSKACQLVEKIEDTQDTAMYTDVALAKILHIVQSCANDLHTTVHNLHAVPAT